MTELELGEIMILETLAAGKTLNDVPVVMDARGHYVASACEIKMLLERGYMDYDPLRTPRNMITEAGRKALEQYHKNKS